MAIAPSTSSIYCRHCGYNLQGQPENRCSECGRAFDPTNRETYTAYPFSVTRRRWAKRLVIAFAALLLLAGVGLFSLWWPWQRNEAIAHVIRQRGGYVATRIVGPAWLQNLLGERGGFLLERVTRVDLRNPTNTDADLAVLDGASELSFMLLDDSSVTGSGFYHLRNLDRLETLGIEDAPVTDASLKQLSALKGLHELRLFHTKVTDAGLANLKTIQGLQTLELSETNVTDAGLEQLQGLTYLRRLTLGRTHVTDAGLKYLVDLHELRDLELNSTSISDVGVERLQALPQLQYLDLSGTKVSDASVKRLVAFKELRRLDLEWTFMTKDGITAIRKALPGCNVVYQGNAVDATASSRPATP